MKIQKKWDNELDADAIGKRGYCVVRLDSSGIARPVRIQSAETPLTGDELLIRYTKGSRRINIGAESFFFEEGQSEKYEKAKFGGVKVDPEGNSLLIGLFDEQKNRSTKTC